MRKKYTIEDMLKLAEERDGKCLSKDYLGIHTKLTWECSKGHQWEATPNPIMYKDVWCPKCGKVKAGKKKQLGIELMHKIAKKRGGKCLSEEYVDSHKKLKWQCGECGHIWRNSPTHIIHRKQWCPKCAGNLRHSIENMQKVAEKKGGKCLSKEYVDNKTKLTWECSEGHKWEASPRHIIHSNSWCPSCYGNIELTLEEMQEIAAKRGGKCLSKSYKNAHTKMSWICKDGHEWKATASAVKYSNQWCPICHSGLSERICREIFERIFNKKFPKKKPKWLTNPETNGRMELDGFCEELGIAFEYHGIQHFERHKHFHSKRHTLENRIEMDQLKRELCKTNGVILIEVPYNIDEEGKYDNIIPYIVQECRKHNLELPEVGLNVFDLDSFDIHSPGKLDEMREVARKRGGEFLSNVYLGSKVKHKWRCEKGHEWEAAPVMVIRDTWCPECGRERTTQSSRKYTIQDMQELAANKGGFCLSSGFVSIHKKLKWRCNKGHEWDARPNSIIHRGNWCPHCSGRRDTIKTMEELAAKMGGKCLSTDYIDSKTKLKWQCKEGHIWEQKPSHIKQGSWCPNCIGRGKTIVDFQKIAKVRGGKCLSEKYINNRTKLKWRCSEGHIWEAAPSNIKRGQWCPYCSGRMGNSIELMEEIARSRGGKCLSKEYTNVHSKLTWQCKEGHVWEAEPNSVKRGTWCRKCAGKKKWD